MIRQQQWLVNIRVDLATTVGFKEVCFMGKRYKVLVQGDVAVNRTTGKKMSDKSIKLNNMQNHHISWWVTAGLILDILVIGCFLVGFVCCCLCCASSDENRVAATDGGVELIDTLPNPVDALACLVSFKGEVMSELKCIVGDHSTISIYNLSLG